MAYEFRLDLAKANGTKFAEVTDFGELACSVAVNTAGMLVVEFPINHSAVAELEERSQVDLYMRDLAEGLPWTPFFGGVYISQERNYTNVHRFTLSAVGYLWLVDTRINAYHSNYSGRTKFISTPAETIMKEMVKYNLTQDATVLNGRLRDGTAWPSTVIMIEPDQGRGVVRDWYSAQAKLTENFRDLSKVGGGDFDLVKHLGGFEFRFYEGQRGVDRREDVIFSLEHGNMGAAVYRRNRIAEATVAIVGGQGDDASRDFAVVESDTLGFLSDLETFAPATQVEPGNIAGLQTAGEKKLADSVSREEFEFTIIQTPGSRYAIHYGLGDLATAVNPYTGGELLQQIVKAELTLRSGAAPQLVVKSETFYAS